MTATDDRAPWAGGGGRPLGRLKRARLVLAADALVFGALWAVGALAFLPALAGFAVIAAIALLSNGGAEAAPATDVAGDGAALRPGDPLVEALLSGMPDPVVALDARGEVVAFNVLASAIAPALRRGEPVALALRNPEIIEAIRRVIASGAVRRAEFVVRLPVERWYEAIVKPVAVATPPSEQPAQLVLVTFHDHTPLRRVEEMRADFVANASHELRTPLAALSGFIETLRGPARDDPAARDRFLSIMHAQATRMARLIDDLLSLSRIELNAHLRPDQEVDLVPIVRQVVDGLQMLARDRGVTMHVSAPADHLLVLGDRDELLRVFENLVENALKYAASGKRIDISLSTGAAAGGAREARVAVRDYGPGIEREHLPRLTERFYRVDVAESRAQGGTGLGLALVKHILNRHGGRLAIESVAGQGATFTAHLPLARAGSSNNLQVSSKA